MTALPKIAVMRCCNLCHRVFPRADNDRARDTHATVFVTKMLLPRNETEHDLRLFYLCQPCSGVKK